MTSRSSGRQALVSVLIPAFNAAQWIGDTLDSVLGQTWSRLEIIVVDDGSRDETASIARKYEGYGVRVYTQENAGPGAARNRAYDASHGEYVQYLDADDLLSPEKIEASVELLESRKEPRAFAVSRWGRFCSSVADAEHHDEPTFQDWQGFPLMLQLLTGQPSGMQPAGSWLVPRSLCEAAGRWPEDYLSPIDDGEYLFRLLAHCSTMRFANRGMLYYRSGIQGFSTLRKPAAIEGIFRSYVAMTALLRASENSLRTHRATARTFQHFLYTYYAVAPEPLVGAAAEMIQQYGGPTELEPEGSPRFHTLRRFIGWKAARRVETVWRQLVLLRTRSAIASQFR